jgi:heat shock protein HtpX
MEHAYGLYTHIRANKRRSMALLIALFGLVYVMVFAGALAGEALSWNASLDWLIGRAANDWLAAAPWATLGTALWILVAYKFHQRLIDLVTGGYPVTRREQPRLWDLLETLCISRGLTMPKLKIMDSDALNAFATGMNPQQYSITVTQGLLQTLKDAELEAVLGHELTHIRNGDVRLLVIAVVIAGVISFFAELVVRIFFQSGLAWGGGRRRSDDERRGSGGTIYALLIAVALVAIAWILSIMIRFALSRSREYLADAGSVELTKNPDAMIMALRKIEGRGDLARANSAIMEMCVDNPREDFADLFDTHPPIQSRIDALVKFAGGHDPGPIELPSANEATAQAEPSSVGPWGGSEATASLDAGASPSGQPQPWGESPPPPTTPLEPPGPWGPRQGREP